MCGPHCPKKRARGFGDPCTPVRSNIWKIWGSVSQGHCPFDPRAFPIPNFESKYGCFGYTVHLPQISRTCLWLKGTFWPAGDPVLLKYIAGTCHPTVPGATQAQPVGLSRVNGNCHSAPSLKAVLPRSSSASSPGSSFNVPNCQTTALPQSPQLLTDVSSFNQSIPSSARVALHNRQSIVKLDFQPFRLLTQNWTASPPSQASTTPSGEQIYAHPLVGSL